jgi:hypothetical protein
VEIHMCRKYICTNTFGLVAITTNMEELIYSYYFFFRRKISKIRKAEPMAGPSIRN